MKKKKHKHWPHHPWWEESATTDTGAHPADNVQADAPWDHWRARRHHPPQPPWWKHRGDGAGWRHTDQGLFFRFALVFGILVLLGCGILSLTVTAAFFLLRGGFPAEPRPIPLIWFMLSLVIVLAFVLYRVGRVAAGRFTTPLGETMRAADALAAGDLSARVPVEGGGEFRRFARSFNEMAEALQTADRQRRELLADVAHELRTPLTVIQGNLEGLRDGVYDATPEHLDLVLDESHKLARLVDDLRLLAVAEAGQLPMEPQMLDVAQFLVDVRAAFALQADEAGINLTVDEPDPLPLLSADPQRLGQVLGNLVANALRHTSQAGQVTLGARLESDGGEIELWVADTGEGIPPEDLPFLFERFYRADKSRARTTGGAGLGLPIARQLVRAHGGRISVESTLGIGTRFTVSLPISAR